MTYNCYAHKERGFTMTKKSIPAIIHLIAHLVIFTWQFFQQSQVTGSALAFETQIYLWGAFFIRTLLMTFAVQIAIFTVLYLFGRLRTRHPAERKEDRDQLLVLRSLRNCSITFASGFFLAMLLLMLNFSIGSIFQVLAFSYALAGIFFYASQIFYHENIA